VSTPDEQVVAAAAQLLSGTDAVVAPSAEVAALLSTAGVPAACRPLEQLAPGATQAVALLADEVSTAGEHADELVATVVRALVPGGLVAVTALSQVHNHSNAAGRTYRSDELNRLLGHHGIDVGMLYAPGAAALVTGEAGRTFDPDRDRLPGLLDAAPRLLALGHSATSATARSTAFLSTLPYKVVAAGVLCRDDDGRLLVVHDSFKGHWTIPGGVVDADENPRDAAVREAWEEAGVRVSAGPVLGVFAASWPDRVVLVYAATPRSDVNHRHIPVHAHEIDEVAWWPLAEALDRLAPHIAEQVRHCLDEPGGTLSQRLA
jgi:8-oxo-dGTP pyrophosphatase MutT (NUDIX family)